MIYAHRANLSGPTGKYYENSPERIKECIEKGFGVEIDLWVKKGGYYLGHDEGYLREIDLSLLEENASHLLIHCKNRKSLEFMWTYMSADFHYFTHQNDKIAFTNQGSMISFSDKIPKLNKKGVDSSGLSYLKKYCIVMLPEQFPGLIVPKGYSVCTDYPEEYLCKL